MRRAALCLHFALCIVHFSSVALAQDLIGQPVVSVVAEQEGQPVTDPVVLSLIDTKVGQPLSMVDVRGTTDHLYNLRRFDDIQTSVEPVAGGVRVRYVLMPSHPIDEIEFRGNVALSSSDLRRVVTDRFGRSPNPARLPEIEKVLLNEFRQRGYPAARISFMVLATHNPHRSTLVFDVDAGRRARIVDVQFRQLDTQDPLPRPDIRTGEPYDAEKVRNELDRWEQKMRAQGFYQANASVGANIPDDAILIVSLTRGPRVMVEFTGDALPEKERDRLVPIRAQGSADEDLLEDAKLGIQQYFQARGYRDAKADYSRDDKTPGLLKITFHIQRGPHYTIENVRIVGNSAIPTEELEKLFTAAKGQEFVAATIDRELDQVRAEYLARGFRQAQVMSDSASLPPDSPDSSDRRVEVVVNINEGPRTIVRAITFKGNTVFSDSQLLASISAAIGERYLASDVADDRNRIAIRYRNQGYLDVAVQQQTTFSGDGTQADITYTVTEGRQAIVDQIIITGNDKTKAQTILDELEIHEGAPLAESAYINSRTKLARLGLFRSVEMNIVEHPGEARRDVRIIVVEADRTTLGLGGGVEATQLARPTGPNGVAEEHIVVAPRGEFEIGRRNLWGSRRSVNLFARVALRSTDVLTNDPADPNLIQTNNGFNEFRVIGTFRDPRLFNTRSELLVTASVEQAPRTSFNFARRIARVEVGRALTPAISVAGRYSFEKERLFDQIFLPQEGQLIDRLFPQIRLSKLAGTFIFDTRDNLLDPSTGRLVIVDTDLALAALGSEFGFVKTFAQGFLYRQLPTKRRMIVALGARVGVASGFTNITQNLEVDSANITVNQDVRLLPASERFFAGGDTTVRGFSLDRLVNRKTVAQNGFPIGGNSVVILNAELRSHLFGIVQGVGFIDAGNVFLLATDFGLFDVRPAAGFGIRINTDFGPIRFDLGFNLNPQVFGDAPRESRTVFFVSIGQAF